MVECWSRPPKNGFSCSPKNALHFSTSIFSTGSKTQAAGKYTSIRKLSLGLLWETADILAYQAIIEELRKTLFWGTDFEIVEIVPAIENAYATHYGVEPL